MSTNLHIIRKLFEYSLKNIIDDTTLVITIFEILMFKVTLVLVTAEPLLGNESVKFLVKNQKINK